MPISTRAEAAAAVSQLNTELGKVIVGQDHVVEEVLVALSAGGHALLEGVPGLAKTLLISTLASATRLSFNRVQFTPDLMPSDITGTEVIREDKASGTRELAFLPGPIFASVILADEINRTPPKTQAALLEAMQERQVSAGGVRRPLPKPFFVLATQNPIEQEGTYPLPEAQLDRFLLKIRVGYPTEEQEVEIIRRTTGNVSGVVNPVLGAEDLLAIQHLVRDTPVADGVVRYALALVRATRPPAEGGDPTLTPLIRFGAGPRAGQALILAAKARATLRGRAFVTLEDVRAMVAPVMRHRLMPSYEAEARSLDSDAIVAQVIERIRLPESAIEKDHVLAAATN
ncbi:MAG: MoxR family ATPase [Planctomycetota bacterium]